MGYHEEWYDQRTEAEKKADEYARLLRMKAIEDEKRRLEEKGIYDTGSNIVEVLSHDKCDS